MMFKYNLVIKGNLFDGNSELTRHLPPGTKVRNIRDADDKVNDCIIEVSYDACLVKELQTWFLSVPHFPPYPTGSLLFFSESN